MGEAGVDREDVQPMKLFLYGTLLEPQVYSRVVSRTVDANWYSPAILNGFVRKRVIGCHYPAITPDVNSSVRGAIVEPLDGDWRWLDDFEFPQYKRVVVSVTQGDSLHDCYVYIWDEDVTFLHGDWNLDEFVKNDLPGWL